MVPTWEDGPVWPGELLTTIRPRVGAVSSKRMTEDEVVAQLRDGMTIGIGGWGSRRKPMSVVRAILRSDLKDLTIVAYGGPDVGLLCAAGKVKRVIYGFVSLDSIPLEPHFRNARENGTIDVTEYDEGMLQLGLYAAAQRVPFLPTRSGLGSAVTEVNPELKTVADPYGSDDELLAVPALPLDAALIHLNRADERGNAVFTGPDLYFDDLYAMAAEKTYLSTEKVVPTEELSDVADVTRMRIHRYMVDGVIEAPNGAHFTTCEPDYRRDEKFQKAYATAAKTPEGWSEFEKTYLSGDEAAYQAAVAEFKNA